VPNREDIELAFNVELETRKAMRSISTIDRQLRKTVSQKLQIKAFDSKGIQNFSKELARSKNALRGVAFSMSPKTRRKFDQDFKAMGLAYKHLTKVVRREKSKITVLEKRALKEQDVTLKRTLEDQLETEKKASLKSIRMARKGYDTKRRAFGKKVVGSGAGAEIEKRSAQAKQAKEFIEGIKSHKTGAELAEGFKDAVGAMSGKDIFGLGRAGMKMSGSLLKGLAKGSMAKGAGVAAKGAEMGGMTGATLKGIGGAMKGIGPLLGSLSKLGPMLGLVGGALFALVKLFLDADAAVKEMNRTVLEGGSTWDTYASKGRNVEAGMEKMDESLKRLRSETTNLKMNSSMGTTAKEHQQVINTLEREGVTLEKMTVSFQKYTDITKQSIVYSRLFGVSVDEIAQMQAEMMQQMGSGLSSLGKEFDSIGRAAEESGIAQNKFFAMLRGVSSDLALYGVRIGETTKMLGQLGKVMSPRSADKFLKTFAQGFKGKSIQDRLKSMLLGGPAAIKAVQSSISDQLTDLVKQVQEAVPGLDAESAKAMLAGKTVGGQSLRKLEKTGKLQGAGSLIEAFQKLSTSAKQAGQGAYGAAQASENLGGFGAYKAVKAGLKLSGKKTFEEAVTGGVPSHQAAILASGGEEQLEANLAIERAIRQQKNDLIAAVDDPAGNEDLIAILTKMGKITEGATVDQRKAAVESMSEDELWRSLDQANAKKNQSQLEKDSEAMRQMGAEQGKRTQDMLSKLDLIFDALYNYIYSVLMDLDDMLTAKFLSPKTAVEKKAALGSKSGDVVKAWAAGGGDLGKFMGAMSGSTTAKSIDQLLHSKDEKDIVGKKEQARSIANLFASGSLTGDLATDMGDALKAAGIDGPAAGKVLAGMEGVGKGDAMGVMKAISGGGLNEDQMADLYSKMGIWFTDSISRRLLMEGAPETAALGRKYANLGMGGSSSTASSTTAIPTLDPVLIEGVGTRATANPATAIPTLDPVLIEGVGTGTTASPATAMPTLPDEQKMSAAVMDQIDFTGGATVSSLQDLWNAMRVKGVKLDKTQLNGDYQDVIHKGTHLGAQDALFEYALYTSTNPAETLSRMKASGFGGLNTLTSAFEDQQKNARESGNAALLPNAAGGVVTGVNGGFATVNPAPGEGLASVGRGERIVPAGGGGGEIHLHVDGIGGADLANFLKGKIAQGIYEYKRREKLS
jgi:hypothetical protein